MLNNILDFKNQSLAGRIANGTVVNNSDPLFLGRVKVRCPDVHPENISDENLPWVESLQFRSNGNSQGNINVPDILTTCKVLFPSDDLYSAIYLTALPNVQLELLADYPYSYGFIDRFGSLFFANTKTGYYTWYHTSGTKISCDGSGHVQALVTNNSVGESSLPEGVDLQVSGPITFKSISSINFEAININFSANSAINFSAPSINNNADTFKASASASATIESSGNTSIIGSGGSYQASGGSKVDGKAISEFKTDVSQTPFYAFVPVGNPLPANSKAVKTSPIIIETAAERSKQANGG